ncbi:hypothetical protein [Methylomicrobium lacus]|uniref:hypothetical protein n=1 Tax=Methylomicrobium lacus TaxID=136992 RepID=UPI0035A99110
MHNLSKWLLGLVDLWHSIKDRNLRWRRDNQAELAQLRQQRILAEKALETELKKHSVQLEHEIALLKTRHDAELLMYKTRCKQDIKDYQHYLDSLDQLKKSIQNSYTHLPESVALTIHHHAKHLLHSMWEAEDYEQKIQYEMQLIQFMTAVHEDARLYLEDANTGNLPESTLKLMRKN